MTAEEFRVARVALGLSAEGLARLVEVSDGRTVRRWARGERDVPGPVAVILRALLDSPAVRQYFGLTIESDPRAVRQGDPITEAVPPISALEH